MKTYGGEKAAAWAWHDWCGCPRCERKALAPNEKRRLKTIARRQGRREIAAQLRGAS